MKNTVLSLLCIVSAFFLYGQSDIENLKSALLVETPMASDLDELCNEIGGRITGSPENREAVRWAMHKFEEMGVSAWKDPFEMPVLWLPGQTTARVHALAGDDPEIVSKYGTARGIYTSKLVSVGTGHRQFFEAKADVIRDRFVIVETDLCLDIEGLFNEYRHAAEVEALAYEFEAAGIIFMSSRPKGLLYRFLSSRTTDPDIIPQFVMERQRAREIMEAIAGGQHMEIEITVNVRSGGSFQAHNVIAEIPGSKYPGEYIVIGAHLDSWALGTGANDNGCNVVMIMDIARQMHKLGIRPDRTIRFALWNGEEQGYFGSLDYTLDHLETLDDHVMAMSVDIGSGAIIGFFTNGRQDVTTVTDSIVELAAEFGPFAQINAPIVGTDNFDFMLQGVPNLVGNHKPFNYGLNYHASTDTYDKVDLESLKKNAAIVGAVTLGFANLSSETRNRLPRQTRDEISRMLTDFNLEFTMRMFNVWDPWVNNQRGRQ